MATAAATRKRIRLGATPHQNPYGYDPDLKVQPGDPRLFPAAGLLWHPSQPVRNEWSDWADANRPYFNMRAGTLVPVDASFADDAVAGAFGTLLAVDADAGAPPSAPRSAHVYAPLAHPGVAGSGGGGGAPNWASLGLAHALGPGAAAAVAALGRQPLRDGRPGGAKRGSFVDAGTAAGLAGGGADPSPSHRGPSPAPVAAGGDGAGGAGDGRHFVVGPFNAGHHHGSCGGGADISDPSNAAEPERSPGPSVPAARPLAGGTGAGVSAVGRRLQTMAARRSVGIGGDHSCAGGAAPPPQLRVRAPPAAAVRTDSASPPVGGSPWGATRAAGGTPSAPLPQQPQRLQQPQQPHAHDHDHVTGAPHLPPPPLPPGAQQPCPTCCGARVVPPAAASAVLAPPVAPRPLPRVATAPPASGGGVAAAAAAAGGGGGGDPSSWLVGPWGGGGEPTTPSLRQQLEPQAVVPLAGGAALDGIDGIGGGAAAADDLLDPLAPWNLALVRQLAGAVHSRRAAERSGGGGGGAQRRRSGGGVDGGSTRAASFRVDGGASLRGAPPPLAVDGGEGAWSGGDGFAASGTASGGGGGRRRGASVSPRPYSPSAVSGVSASVSVVMERQAVVAVTFVGGGAGSAAADGGSGGRVE